MKMRKVSRNRGELREKTTREREKDATKDEDAEKKHEKYLLLRVRFIRNSEKRARQNNWKRECGGLNTGANAQKQETRIRRRKNGVGRLGGDVQLKER